MERPREIPLDDLNPCDVWTKEQLADLGVGPEPSRGDPEPDMFGNLGCSYGNHPASKPRPDVEITYGVYTYLKSDVEGNLTGHQSRSTPSVVEVAGFPAVQLAQPRGALDACDVYVGTAGGQTLVVYFEVYPNELTVEESCSRVLRAAELAMATVQSLR